MTSKTSSAKPLLYTFTSGLKGPAIAPAIINLVIFTLITVVASLVNYVGTVNTNDEFGNIVIKEATELYKYYIYSNGDILSVFLLISVCIASLIAAVFSFKFITSKKTVNVYYSLGISRDKLYFGKYLSGAFLMVLSVAVPFLLSFAANIIFLGYSKELAFTVLFYILSYSATSLVVYSITAAAFSAVGTFFEAAVFSAVGLSFPTIFFSCLQTLMGAFVNGSPFGSAFTYANSEGYSFYRITSEKLIWSFDFLNPLLFDYSSLSKWAVMDAHERKNPQLMFNISGDLPWYPSLLRAFCWIIVSLAVMFIGAYIFQKRKAEICGFIGTNKILNTFATFTAGFFFLNVVIALADGYISNVLALVIGFAVFAVLYIVLELVLLRDFKAFLRGLFKLPAEMAAAGIIVAVFMTGLFGYSSKIPAASEISKVAVTPVGITAEYGYLQAASYYGNALSGSEDFSYITSVGLVDGFKSQNDIKTVTALHEKLIELGNIDITPYEDTDVTDDDRIMAVTLQFVYTLKNGKTVMRNYDAASADVLKSFLELESTDLFKERLERVFNEKLSNEKSDKMLDTAQDEDIFEYVKQSLRNDDNTVSIVTQNCLSTLNLTLTMAEKAELERCIYKDLLKRSVDEKYFPKENPLGIIRFEYNGYFKQYGMDPGYQEATRPGQSSDGQSESSESEASSESETRQPSSEQTGTSSSPAAPANGSLKISPLSAPVSTTDATEPSTEKSTEAAVPVTDSTAPGQTAEPSLPDTSNTTDTTNNNVIGEEDGEMAGEVLDKAVKISSQTVISPLLATRYDGIISIILTSDMENTISFLKSKGLYNELPDKSTYSSAEIVSVVNYNSAHPYFSYSANSVNRLFAGSYFVQETSNKDENSYYYYSTFDEFNKYATSSKTEISEVFKVSRFLYYNQCDTGYYVRFISADKKDRIVMFVPYSAMPESIRNKVSEFEASNKLYSDNIYGGIRYAY